MEAFHEEIWLPPPRARRDDTMHDETVSTHREPKLNELSPDDETVTNLVGDDPIPSLPAVPVLDEER